MLLSWKIGNASEEPESHLNCLTYSSKPVTGFCLFSDLGGGLEELTLLGMRTQVNEP